MMDMDDINRMLVEIMTGKDRSASDTPEEAVMREQLKKECAAIVARGGDVDIPHDIPDVQK